MVQVGNYYGGAVLGNGGPVPNYSAPGFPTSPTVEVEFTASVWTDITTYVDWSAGLTTKFGRTTPFAAPQAATMDLTLDNTDGRFTPFREVLTDGTSNPYYPNVIPKKRIRFSYTNESGTVVRRFLGYIRGWPPSFKDASRPRVTISCVDRMEILSKNYLLQSIQQEITKSFPDLYFRFNEDSSATEAVNQGYATDGTVYPNLTIAGTGDALTFGADGVNNNGASVQFNPSAATTGQYLKGSAITRGIVLYSYDLYWGMECWVNVGTAARGWDSQTIFNSYATDSNAEIWVGVNSAGNIKATANSTVTGSSVLDGGWHHVAFRVYLIGAAGPTDYQYQLVLDGVSQGTGTLTGGTGNFPLQFTVGGPVKTGSTRNCLSGKIAHLTLNSINDPDTTLVNRYQAGLSWVGETVDTRIKRLLGYAGLAASDYSIAASTVTLNSQSTDGVDIVSACQDLATTEGGGSAFYVTPDGYVKFVNRQYRTSGNPKIAVDQAADCSGGTWNESFDADSIVNQSNASKQSASGSNATFIIKNNASVAKYGLITEDYRSYAQSSDDVKYSAQYRIASQASPLLRLNQLAIELNTAMTPGLYEAVGNAGIGDMIFVTNMPTTAGGSTQTSLVIEGWSDSVSDMGYTVTFDTSPADSPAQFIWDDGTYGRWQVDDTSVYLRTKLTSNITSTDTSLSVTLATVLGVAGRPFTTDSTMYPLVIQIGAEQIMLNTPPGGSTSPQVFTGVTRGVNGTTAAAHLANSTMELIPTSGWTM